MQTQTHTLISLLNRSVNLLEQVLESLHRERQAMIMAEHTLLLELVEEKTQTLDALADCDVAMQAILSTLNDQASMALYLQTDVSTKASDGRCVADDAGEKATLRALWEYYIALLSACRDKNHINSNVVHLRLGRLHYESQLMTQGVKTTAGYDAKGHIQTVIEADPETVA